MTPGEAITAEGLAALKAEIAELEGPVRAELAKKIKAAREEGDLSENAEYHALKEEQGHLETKILRLHRAAAQRGRRRGRRRTPSVVTFGSTVRVTDVEAEREQTFTLVGPDRGRPQGGQALVGVAGRPRPDGRGPGRRRRGRVAARRPQVARRRDRRLSFDRPAMSRLPLLIVALMFAGVIASVVIVNGRPGADPVGRRTR